MAGGKRILVVDDDVMLRELAETVLGEIYEVRTASDGQEGLELALAWKPDLVVTDLMMPRMHGYELCQRLKAPDGLPGVKIVVASSKAFPADLAQAKNAGADAYVLKPYNVSDLTAKVAEVLSGAARAAAQAPAARAMEAASEPALSAKDFYIRFWGTRGSIPISSAATMRHGGNTACVEVRAAGKVLVVDCGTGLRDLGIALSREFAGRPLKGHIFVGHTHWDHVQGFPFFTPFYNPANAFRVYSVRGARGSLGEVFSGTMTEDYFPVPLSGLGAKPEFVELSGPLDLGPVRVSFIHLNHPGVCIGFRIAALGKSVVYISDHESFYKLGGDNDMSRRQDAAVTEFCRGADLLIREAQYTEEEYPSRKGWGHSTFDDAARDAAAAGVRRLAITHHDPDHDDAFLDAQAARCRALAGSGVDVFMAKDGLRVDL